MPNPTYEVRGDFEGEYTWLELSQDFSSWDELATGEWTWADLTQAKVPGAYVFRFQVDRNLATLRNRLQTGQALIELDNKEGDYTPGDFTRQHPENKITIKAKTDQGSWYGLFSGFVKEFNLDPDIENQKTRLRCEDQASFLRRDINLSLRTDTRPDSLAQAITDEVGIEPVAIDNISDNIPFSLLDDMQGGTALDRVIKSGAHFSYVDGSGTFQFKERGTDSKSAQVVASYTQFLSYDYTLNEDRIINVGKVKGSPRKVTTNVQTVAWLENEPIIKAGENVEFFLSFIDPNTRESRTPADSVATPVSSQDFTLNTQDDGSGTDLTSQASVTADIFAQSAKINFRNTSSKDGFITKMKLRGFPLRRAPALRATTTVDSSVDKFGEHPFTVDNDLIPDQNFARDYSEFLTQKWADPFPELQIAVKNDFPNVLQNELLSKIHVQNSLTSVNTAFLIESVRHNVDLIAGLEHTTEYTLTLAKKADALVIDPFILNESELGGDDELAFER